MAGGIKRLIWWLRSCDRFSRLVLESRDRELSERERLFIENHRQKCPTCHAHECESSMVLNLLANERFEVEVDDSFDARVIRLTKVSAAKDSLRYWSPAIIGAAIACLALTASLQLVTRTSDVNAQPVKGSEAKRSVAPRSARPLDLSAIPTIR